MTFAHKDHIDFVHEQNANAPVLGYKLKLETRLYCMAIR